MERIPDIVRAHHEKLDGSGYPHGLPAEEIPPEARLLAVCDVFDALTAWDRPYRKAMPAERAIEVLRSDVADGGLDADWVELFVAARPWTDR